MVKYYACFLKRRNRWLPLSRAIELIEGTPYSHCEILRVVLTEDNVILKAEFYGAVSPVSRVTDFKDIKSKYILKDKIELDVKDVKEMDEALNRYLNIKYSYLQLLTNALIASWKVFYKILKDINVKKEIVCTEYIYWVLKDVFNIDTDITPDTVGLVEILELCKLKEVKYASNFS